VFAHPIHFGIFCSLVLSLVYVGLNGHWQWFKRYVIAGIVGFCGFLSVSSGPVLAMGVQIALIGWAWMMKWSEYRWRIFALLTIIGYAIIEIGSDRTGIYAVVQRLSFNPQTAFSRRILFEKGLEQVSRTPILGIGRNPLPLPAWMTGSIDNFWLFITVTFGVPAFLLFFGALVVAMVRAGRRDFSQVPEVLPLRMAWIFTMASLALILATVAIWGELYAIVVFMFGSGIWLQTISTEGKVPHVANPQPEMPNRKSVQYTRYAHKKPPSRSTRVTGPAKYRRES